MNTPRAEISMIPTPVLRSEGESLERMWGVSMCHHCGATIVLGDSLGRSSASLCVSCRALPAASPVMAPIRLRLDGGGVRGSSATPTVIGAREREAA